MLSRLVCDRSSDREHASRRKPFEETVLKRSIAHGSRLTAHCSLLTAHCSLLTAHCSLLSTLLIAELARSAEKKPSRTAVMSSAIEPMRLPPICTTQHLCHLPKLDLAFDLITQQIQRRTAAIRQGISWEEFFCRFVITKHLAGNGHFVDLGWTISNPHHK